jgi:hypothetical protein
MPFIEAHHDANLVIELFIRTLDTKLCGKMARGFNAEEVTAVPCKAVMGFASEVGSLVGCHVKRSGAPMPLLRLVQPHSILESFIEPVRLRTIVHQILQSSPVTDRCSASSKLAAMTSMRR